MPPKRGGPVQRGGPAPQRGSARGGRGGGGPPTRGGGAGPASSSSSSAPAIIPADHIQSIGVKRISYGKSGKEVKVITNQFELKSECPRIFHYDGKHFLFVTSCLIADSFRLQSVRRLSIFSSETILILPSILPSDFTP